MAEAYAEFTNWLRSIDPTIRLVVMVAFAIVACLCLIRFLNKNVNKPKINWLFIAAAVICVVCIVFLAIYR